MNRDKDMLTDADVREALMACFTSRDLYDRPINVVDLGLVAQIDLEFDPDAPGNGIPGVPPRQTLKLQLLSPTLHEDAKTILLAQVRNRLAGLPQLSRIHVAWTEGSLGREAHTPPSVRDQVMPAFSILNNRRRV